MAASSKLLLFLFVLITIAQIYLNWTRIAELSAEKHRLETQIQTFRREFHWAERGRSSNGGEQNDLDSLPPIVFVTPTAYRATQKADLTRLAQTLANVRSLFWIVIEDSDTASPFVDDLLIRLNIQSVHLTALTPPEKKANSSEPVNKFPRGVAQRNAALKWIRANLASWTHGVLYFGDDDNTYDWRLFDEMRTIRRVGVWPVGIVGGTLVETPLLHENNGSVRKFSVLWKPNRQFPIDMAGFALNLSLIHASPEVQFSYQSKRGFMETDFLESLKLSLADLEPKAKKCTKVFVWHTRTERANLGKLDMQKLLTRRALSPLERDVLF